MVIGRSCVYGSVAHSSLLPPARSALIRIALFQPDIPQNTGTILRLAACLGLAVDIIEPAGFDASDRNFRRAGLDYLDHVPVERHASFDRFLEAMRAQQRRIVLFTTKAQRAHAGFPFEARDVLLFGRESAGVSQRVHDAADIRLRIPMRANLRSINVAMSVALAVGEAMRATDGWSGLEAQ